MSRAQRNMAEGTTGPVPSARSSDRPGRPDLNRAPPWRGSRASQELQQALDQPNPGGDAVKAQILPFCMKAAANGAEPVE